MKTCFKCGKTKPTSEFYKHSKMKDGHLNKCKDCAKSDTHSHRLRNIEYVRQYDRLRGNRQTIEQKRAYRKNNKEKYKAHTKANNALRDGKIEIKNKCEICGKIDRLHKHHQDYSEPLNVVWVCPACHLGYLHKRTTNENNRSVRGA